MFSPTAAKVSRSSASVALARFAPALPHAHAPALPPPGLARDAGGGRAARRILFVRRLTHQPSDPCSARGRTSSRSFNQSVRVLLDFICKLPTPVSLWRRPSPNSNNSADRTELPVDGEEGDPIPAMVRLPYTDDNKAEGRGEER